MQLHHTPEQPGRAPLPRAAGAVLRESSQAKARPNIVPSIVPPDSHLSGASSMAARLWPSPDSPTPPGVSPECRAPLQLSNHHWRPLVPPPPHCRCPLLELPSPWTMPHGEHPSSQTLQIMSSPRHCTRCRHLHWSSPPGRRQRPGRRCRAPGARAPLFLWPRAKRPGGPKTLAGPAREPL
jgi:hypothetical protein